MNPELTEEEMRRALFGNAEVSAPINASAVADPIPEVDPAAKQTPGKEESAEGVHAKIESHPARRQRI